MTIFWGPVSVNILLEGNTIFIYFVVPLCLFFVYGTVSRCRWSALPADDAIVQRNKRTLWRINEKNWLIE